MAVDETALEQVPKSSFVIIITLYFRTRTPPPLTRQLIITSSNLRFETSFISDRRLAGY
jgi:hypothetical protein